MAADVFLSYSKVDGPTAERLTKDIMAAGFSVWEDNALTGGQEWATAIEEAIRAATVMVVVLTEGARQSEWVARETLLALDLQKPVLPCRFDDTPLPIHLVNLPYIDFTGDYNRGLEQLLTALGDRGRRGRQTSSAPPSRRRPPLTEEVSAADNRDPAADFNINVKTANINAPQSKRAARPPVPPPVQGEAKTLPEDDLTSVASFSRRAQQTATPDTPPSADPAAPPITPRPLPSFIYVAWSSDAWDQRDFPARVVEALRGAGYGVWVSFEHNQSEPNWRPVAQRALERAAVLVVVGSPYAYRSPNVRWETDQALAAGKLVLAAEALPAAVPPFYANFPQIDLTDEPPEWTALFAALNAVRIEIEYVAQGGARNDRVAAEDQLEFKHYVNAFADLITSADTEPPLTIGIFGSWGMGKSFLLDHIKRKLNGSPPYEKTPETRILPRPPREWWMAVSRFIYRMRRFESRTHTVIWQRPLLKVRTRFFQLLYGTWQGLRGGLERAAEALRVPVNAIRRHWFDLEGSAPRPPITVKIVEYNAWEYSATDLVWPGLVRKIMQLLEKEIGIARRLRLRLVRNFQKRLPPLQALLLIMVSVVSALVVAFLWRDEQGEIGRSLTVVGVVGLLISVFKLVNATLTTSFGSWVTTLFEKTDYGKTIGYMEDIRADLQMLEKGLARRRVRVLIVVDDLDRCEPEKAVEMLQAIKLLLNFDSFIVMLGIDARVITRAIEKHYEGLLGPAGASGYEYLDKIIQIPFRIPEPTENEIRAFIEKQMVGAGEGVALTSPEAAPLPTEAPPASPPPEAPPDSPAPPPVTPTDLTMPAEPIVKQRQALAFTADERRTFQELAGVLKRNPRHIKRLLNVYRLVKALGEQRGEPFIRGRYAAVIYWVVLCGQWPYTMYTLLREYNERLEDVEEAPAGQQAAKHDEMFPPAVSPLPFLEETCRSRLAEKTHAALRDKLDFDPDLFLRVLNAPATQMTWAELALLRHYTLNFNPAVEAELLGAAPGADGKP